MREKVSHDSPQIYAFGGFTLDAEKRLIFGVEGENVPLMPKAFDILLYLVRNGGRVIEKDELMSKLWPDTIVEENNLTQNISAIRRALGEKHRENRFIATVPGRGYKFVADVAAANGSGGIEETTVENTPAIADDLDLLLDDPRPAPTGRRLAFTIAAAVILAAVSISAFIFLRQDSTNAGNSEIRSLAVLPFKPLVAENRDQAIEIGMADTLISKLSGGSVVIRQLSAVRRFDGIEQDPVEAGRALGVEAVLDGNIQVANDRVRISAKLIRVSDGKQLWAEQYNHRSTDIFELQDSISERVANALKTSLGGRRKNYTENLAAYQLYSKGKFHSARLVLPEVQKGISYFEQAITVDPQYALAYAELANAYRAMVLTNDARPDDLMSKAKAAAEKAVGLDDTLAEAHTALAMTSFWYDFDPVKAEAHHRRAIELNPESQQSRFAYAHTLSNTGRHSEAIVEISRARELDPINLVTNALEGQILFFAGKDDDALRVLRETQELEPSFWLTHLFTARVQLKQGAWDDALAAAVRAGELSGGNSEAIATIGTAHAMAGRTDKARAVLRELEGRSNDRYVSSYVLAQIHAALGEKVKALDLLEQGLVNHDALMVFLKVDVQWDQFRSEPRFADLMRRMKL